MVKDVGLGGKALGVAADGAEGLARGGDLAGGDAVEEHELLEQQLREPHLPAKNHSSIGRPQPWLRSSRTAA